LAQAVQKEVCLPAFKHPEQACPHTEKWTPTTTDLESILETHEQWVEKWRANSFSEDWATNNNQGRANLCNADLQNIQFKKRVLQNAAFDGADLRRANLSEATLIGASFRKANLSDADLTKANLNGVSLE
jgi:uncharacterized protein YjbI with pentapeptide repeats